MDCNINMSKEFINHMKSAHVVLGRTSSWCIECDETFESIDKYHMHLISHVELVSGRIQNNRFVKRFKCSKCGLKFVQKSTLESHAAVHTPLPHICFCGIGYCFESDLLKHKQLVHSIKFQKELQEPTSRKQRALQNEFRTPNINNTGRQQKQKPPAVRSQLSQIARSQIARTQISRTQIARFQIPRTQIARPQIARPQIAHSQIPRPQIPRLRAELVIRSGLSKDKNERPFLCSFCDEAFKTCTTMQNHERTHTGERPYHCELCDKRFISSSHLKRHLDTVHSNKRTFPCSFCGKAFKSLSGMQSHKQIHTGERPYHCELCDKRFITSSSLKLHLDTIHSDKRPFQCSFCDKPFKFRASAKIHERIHTGERPYHCKLCDKHFNQSSSLKRHLERHAGFKSFGCDDCGKEFVIRSALINHKRTHTGEKPFACCFCGKRFGDQSARGRHERTHTGVKPYSCKVCGMKFSDASGSIRHERSHLGIKEQCALCHKKFYTVYQLHRHKISVHDKDNKSYECDHCSKTYSLKESLKKHIRSNHSQ